MNRSIHQPSRSSSSSTGKTVSKRAQRRVIQLVNTDEDYESNPYDYGHKHHRGTRAKKNRNDRLRLASGMEQERLKRELDKNNTNKNYNNNNNDADFDEKNDSNSSDNDSTPRKSRGNGARAHAALENKYAAEVAAKEEHERDAIHAHINEVIQDYVDKVATMNQLAQLKPTNQKFNWNGNITLTHNQ
jgi:hypothetical protein